MAGKETREKFVEWLRSKQPDEIVGYTHGAPHPGQLHAPGEDSFNNLCPLGAYCAETETSDPRYGPGMELVNWAFWFMEAVDEETPVNDPLPINAARCLQLLGEVV